MVGNASNPTIRTRLLVLPRVTGMRRRDNFSISTVNLQGDVVVAGTKQGFCFEDSFGYRRRRQSRRLLQARRRHHFGLGQLVLQAARRPVGRHPRRSRGAIQATGPVEHRQDTPIFDEGENRYPNVTEIYVNIAGARERKSPSWTEEANSGAQARSRRICLGSLSGTRDGPRRQDRTANAPRHWAIPKPSRIRVGIEGCRIPAVWNERRRCDLPGDARPVRPITNYVRVIDGDGPGHVLTGATQSHGRRRDDAGPGKRVFQQVTPEQAGSPSPGPLRVGAVPHAVGFPQRRGGGQRDRSRRRGRRSYASPDLKPRGRGASGDYVVTATWDGRRTSSDRVETLAGRQHHGRCTRRHLHRLEGLRRDDGAVDGSCRRAAGGPSSRSR